MSLTPGSDDSDLSAMVAEQMNNMSTQDKLQFRQFMATEQQKMAVQSSVHGLTEKCFKKCITGSISAGKLASKEEGCMQNCVERFMDSSIAVLKHLETLRAQQ